MVSRRNPQSTVGNLPLWPSCLLTMLFLSMLGCAAQPHPGGGDDKSWEEYPWEEDPEEVDPGPSTPPSWALGSVGIRVSALSTHLRVEGDRTTLLPGQRGTVGARAEFHGGKALCSGQGGDAIARGYGNAVLVGPREVAVALPQGDMKACEEIAVVFDYDPDQVTSQGNPWVPNNQVYYCQNIREGVELAIIELDREVTGRRQLSWVAHTPDEDEPVYVVGAADGSRVEVRQARVTDMGETRPELMALADLPLRRSVISAAVLSEGGLFVGLLSRHVAIDLGGRPGTVADIWVESGGCLEFRTCPSSGTVDCGVSFAVPSTELSPLQRYSDAW